MAKKHPQFILAVDSDFFLKRGFGCGIHYYPFADFYREVNSHLVLRERDALERDPSYRQVLPYKVITQTGADGKLRFIGYRRLEGGGESRLHGLFSVGFGGHVDLADVNVLPGAPGSKEASTVDLESTLRTGSLRELSEELKVIADDGWICEFTPLSIRSSNLFIHYDLRKQLGDKWRVEDDVHSVHVALVLHAEAAPGTTFHSGEADSIELQAPMTADEILSSEMPMEEWTRLYLEFVAKAGR